MKTFTPVVRHYPHMTALIYPRRYEVMYALARFQEHYENKFLAGKYFTRQDLQDLEPDYYVSWNGCNFPPSIVDKFRIVDWGLDRHERVALANMPQGHYIAGAHDELAPPDLKAILKHEYAHALYYAEAWYMDEINAVIDGLLADTRYAGVIAKLSSMYAEHVIYDEFQAYAWSGWEKLGVAEKPPIELLVCQGHCAELCITMP